MAENTLFSYIETLQGGTPWGKVLDAGTGWSSLGWLTGLTTERLTAVTACSRRAEALRSRYRVVLRPQDAVVVGNWVDTDLLRGEVFDVVLADYLVGAVDRFAPYFQGRLLERLRPLVGSVLYLVGLEPYGDAGGSAEGGLVTRIANLRDGCQVLAQDRPHREFPRWWVSEELQRRGYEILSSRSFPIRYGESFVTAELDVCRDNLSRLSKPLQRALAAEEKALRAEALSYIRRNGSLRWGFDYVISARPGTSPRC